MVKSMKTNMVSNSDKSIKQSLIKLRYKKMISSKANTPYKQLTKDKTMPTLDINDPKYFDPYLKTIAQNTDNNNHTENAVLIAYNFGTDFHINLMRKIQSQYNKMNGLEYFTLIARDFIVKDILNNMKNKKLAKKIKVRL